MPLIVEELHRQRDGVLVVSVHRLLRDLPRIDGDEVVDVAHAVEGLAIEHLVLTQYLHLQPESTLLYVLQDLVLHGDEVRVLPHLLVELEPLCAERSLDAEIVADQVAQGAHRVHADYLVLVVDCVEGDVCELLHSADRRLARPRRPRPISLAPLSHGPERGRRHPVNDVVGVQKRENVREVGKEYEHAYRDGRRRYHGAGVGDVIRRRSSQPHPDAQERRYNEEPEHSLVGRGGDEQLGYPGGVTVGGELDDDGDDGDAYSEHPRDHLGHVGKRAVGHG